jgi:hypothetical protein
LPRARRGRRGSRSARRPPCSFCLGQQDVACLSASVSLVFRTGRDPAKMPSKPQRLFVTSALAPGASVELDPTRHTTSSTCSDARPGKVLLFNRKDGSGLGAGAAAKRAIVTLPDRPGRIRRLTCVICLPR